mmetsp:Transcript_74625/g.218764  ORF Transcript_74625/g.218764 Transcript_74625/m.218764 type:complete len:229 (+) Transcript_74625:72-758(+)
MPDSCLASNCCKSCGESGLGRMPPQRLTDAPVQSRVYARASSNQGQPRFFHLINAEKMCTTPSVALALPIFSFGAMPLRVPLQKLAPRGALKSCGPPCTQCWLYCGWIPSQPLSGDRWHWVSEAGRGAGRQFWRARPPATGPAPPGVQGRATRPTRSIRSDRSPARGWPPQAVHTLIRIKPRPRRISSLAKAPQTPGGHRRPCQVPERDSAKRQSMKALHLKAPWRMQ